MLSLCFIPVYEPHAKSIIQDLGIFNNFDIYGKLSDTLSISGRISKLSIISAEICRKYRFTVNIGIIENTQILDM